jgi:hypothetical protein
MKVKNRLADARRGGIEAVRAIEAGLPRIADLESSVAIDLLSSLIRAAKGWNEMIALVDRDVTALARNGNSARATRACAQPSRQRQSEAESSAWRCWSAMVRAVRTLRSAGRVYKDRWEAKRATAPQLRGGSDRAIAAYLRAPSGRARRLSEQCGHAR